MVHTRAHSRHCQDAVSGQPARNCWHIQKSERHTLSAVVGRFYLLIGSRKWMLWENICGRACCELSCTAWTHGLGLQVEGGWAVWGVAGEQTGHGQKRRRGFKKAEPGVWWAEWCMFFPPFPSALACFLSEDTAICWRWCDECRQGTGSTGLSFLVLA